MLIIISMSVPSMNPSPTPPPNPPPNLPKAPSIHDHQIDLLRDHLQHRCSLCLTPLHKFTKIIARRRSWGSEQGQRNGGFDVFCVVCFAGWSDREVGPEEMEEAHYQYYVIRGMGRPHRQLGGWSGHELIQLQACLQKFGPEMTRESREEFVKATGTQKSLAQLRQKTKEIKSAFTKGKEGLSLKGKRKDWKTEEIPTPQLPFAAKRLVSRLNLDSQEHQTQAQQFLKMINYMHPVELARKYPQSHAEVLARASATNSLTQQRVGRQLEAQRPEKEPEFQSSIQLMSDFLRSKAEEEHGICEFISSMAEQYATLKRGNRKLAVVGKQQSLKQLQQLSHPEVSSLASIPAIAEQLSYAVRLRQQRQQIIQQSKRAQRNRIIPDHLLRSDEPLIQSQVSREEWLSSAPNQGLSGSLDPDPPLNSNT